MTIAEKIASRLATDFGLLWPTQVNVEAIVNKMLTSMEEDDVYDCLNDLIENFVRFEINKTGE